MDINNQTIDAVQIVTIKGFKTLYKGEEPALKIEQVLLEENDFTLVAQKDLYQPGDKVIYIQPDYNLPDIELFECFIRPGGDPKKSMLGSKNRIRAKSFNLAISRVLFFSNEAILPCNDLIFCSFSATFFSDLAITLSFDLIALYRLSIFFSYFLFSLSRCFLANAESGSQLNIISNKIPATIQPEYLFSQSTT
jgi:hypothetical protein